MHPRASTNMSNNTTETLTKEDQHNKLRDKLRRKMKSKQSTRLPRTVIVKQAKKKTSTEKGQQEMMDMLQNIDMNAVTEAMKTRGHQRKLKNFKM